MKLRKIKSKKGGIFQLTYLFVFIFIVALVGLLFLKLTWEFTGVFKNMTEINDSEYARESNLKIRNTAPYIHDLLIFFLFLGSTISLMVAAVRTEFSAVIIGLFLILMMITIFVASGLVNIYQGFAAEEELLEVSSKLTFTNILLSKYTPLMLMVISAFILMIMYGKSGAAIKV